MSVIRGKSNIKYLFNYIECTTRFNQLRCFGGQRRERVSNYGRVEEGEGIINQ